MRYVLYAFSAVLVIAMWLNLTSDGKNAKRHWFTDHSQQYAGDN